MTENYGPVTTDLPDDLFDDSPLPGATFPQAVRRLVRRYTVFSGRASRSEYWWVALFYLLVEVGAGVVAAVVAGVTGSIVGDDSTAFGWVMGIVLGLAALAWLLLLIPGIALAVRRMHDANLSGWLLLMCLVPGLVLVGIVFMLLPSNPAGARFDRAVPIPPLDEE
ncbi:MAG: DUF805 domain-containing protein [Cellulomonas sp.]|uniref:DUF805 domain-containing protein n=1 Tax=Cellulomonas sp. TaxID=40001 RepID=UPI0019FCB15C|nr:DUF805 domain-containing protein [Cellulomonas sp.]MBF0688446.1 DUF805 domain-containing protein [Cellulomonas sp.]